MIFLGDSRRLAARTTEWRDQEDLLSADPARMLPLTDDIDGAGERQRQQRRPVAPHDIHQIHVRYVVAQYIEWLRQRAEAVLILDRADEARDVVCGVGTLDARSNVRSPRSSGRSNTRLETGCSEEICC